MANFFVQLYGDIDDLCNSRVLTELDYYMYDVKDKEEMIYYFTREQTIFMVVQGSNWTIDRLQVLIRTALRENSFILIPLDNYTGYMSKTVWDNIKDESKKFFDDPKPYRLAAGRGNKLTKLMCRIKRAITPKEKEK